MPKSATEKVRMSRPQRILLSLLVVSIFINYIDRGNLSVAAPLLKTELSLSPEQLGILLSAFFWTYAALQLFGIAGWLVERLNVYWVYGIAFLVWSVATAATGLVSGFVTLLVLRLLLGLGESIAYPAYSKIFATGFHEHQRGLANGLVDAGCKLGPGIGTLAGGLLMARFGWRAFFIVLGMMSLAWLFPWTKLTPRGRNLPVAQTEAAPGFGDILRKRAAWGTFIGLFCGNYFWYFLLTWLPSYLVMERHFSMDMMASVGALAYFAIAVSTTFCGWLSDRWIVAGATTTRVRKGFVAAGLAFSTIILPVAVVDNVTVSMILLMVACVSFGLFSSNNWPVTQTLAGPSAAGTWTSLQNGIGNLAGVAAPAITGFVVQKTGQFYLAFLVAAVILLTGATAYLFVIGPIQPVAWKADKGQRESMPPV